MAPATPLAWMRSCSRSQPWGTTEPRGRGLNARGVSGGGGGVRGSGGGPGGGGDSVAAHCPWHPGGVGPAGRPSPWCQVDDTGSSSPDARPRRVLTRTSTRVVVAVAAPWEGADAVVVMDAVIAALVEWLSVSWWGYLSLRALRATRVGSAGQV